MNLDTLRVNKPKVSLICQPSSLGLYIAERLLSSYCSVTVFTPEPNTWEKKYSHLRFSKSFAVVTTPAPSFGSPDYVVTDFSDLSNTTWIEETLGMIRVSENLSALRILMILPFAVNSSQGKILKKIIHSFSKFLHVKIIYVGQTYGPRMLSGESVFAAELFDALTIGEAVSKDAEICLSYSPYTAKEIVKCLLSFDFLSVKTIVITTIIKHSELINILGELLPELKIKKARKIIRQSVVGEGKRYVLQTNVYKSLSETLTWFIKRPELLDDPEDVPLLTELRNQYFDRKLLKSRIATTFAIFATVFVVLPVVLLLLSGATLFISYKRIAEGDLNSSKAILSFSKTTARIAGQQTTTLASVPILGHLFKLQHNSASLLLEAGELGDQVIYVGEKASSLVANVIGQGELDISRDASDLAVGIDALYRQTAFIESDLLFLEPFSSSLLYRFTKLAPTEIREYLLYAKTFATELPDLLGQSGKVSYMVLFQNNMELRPTGGFIGSFALVDFERGKLVNYEIFDVYEADGQLKGYVAPPEPISKYLGEAAWYMRDGNWDPDFPVSAERIEWFLAKELEKEVEGVVAIDLNAVALLLDNMGPVYLADFNKEIGSHNLYEETQEEVELEFFPGSYRKRNFLTALARSLMLEVTEADSDLQIAIIKSLLTGLDRKHIQVFLHNHKAQATIGRLGFGGEVSAPSCLEPNCTTGYTGLVEANVGVNKINYHIKRTTNLDVFLDEERIKNTLEVTYTNSSSVSHDPSVNNIYKNYLRLLIPKEAVGVSAFEDENQIEHLDIIDTAKAREVGVLINVGPESQKKVRFVWEQPAAISYDESGQYTHYWRKQAGTAADPVVVRIIAPKQVSLSANLKGDFLTSAGTYVYNTNLLKDLVLNTTWQPQ